MKITGFSFIKNAEKLGYPAVEAIKSILPICTDFVIAVGKSTDSTLQMIADIDKEKIKIIQTTWDASLRAGGKVLAQQTNIAFQAISADADWAFYIQGDEVVHEKYLPTIHDEMARWKDNKKVDGLLFNYHHFYGSYKYIGNSPRWYSKEIRIIKNDKSIYSYRDAQGFRKQDNKKLNVKPINAYIYHYGWVREPEKMQKKQTQFSKLYHNDSWMTKNISTDKLFNYNGIDSLKEFKETHPKEMLEIVKNQNWKFEYNTAKSDLSLKNKVKLFLLKYFNIKLGYKNYKIV